MVPANLHSKRLRIDVWIDVKMNNFEKNTQAYFTLISLITFEVLNQTSPNLQGSRRNGCEWWMQKYMWSGWELTEISTKNNPPTLVQCWLSVFINNFWSSQWNFPKFTGHLRWYQPMVPAKLHGKRLRIDVWIGV